MVYNKYKMHFVKGGRVMTEKASVELLSIFLEKGLTFSSAESCTGGMICESLTALAGSSAVVLGGVVSYSNEVKMKVLGVKEETLSAFGAVSEETAYEMAEGVNRLTGADVSVSVTGIAGPSGGSLEKPVGTVCFGVTCKGMTKTNKQNFSPSFSRDEIRRLSTVHAINMAIKAAKEL